MSSALRKFSEAEYLAGEETRPVKREYVDGFVCPLHAQAGASSRHDLIVSNLVAVLHRPTRQQGGHVYARYAESPCLLAEVLSEMTRATDLGDKIRAYQSLLSVQGYLLVDTDTRAARLFARDGEGWREGSWEGEGKVELPCVGVTLTLGEMYAGTRV